MRFGSDKSAELPVKESRRENPRYNEKSGEMCYFFFPAQPRTLPLAIPAVIFTASSCAPCENYRQMITV